MQAVQGKAPWMVHPPGAPLPTLAAYPPHLTPPQLPAPPMRRYEAFKAIKEGPQWGQLTEAQQRIVDGELRDFVLGGVALEVHGRLA